MPQLTRQPWADPPVMQRLCSVDVRGHATQAPRLAR